MGKSIAICITLAEQGGAQSFVARFAPWLVARGHEVTVYAGTGTWLADRLRGSNVKFVNIPHLSREIDPLRDPLALLWLRREFRRTKPDAIHLNSAKMGILGSVAAWRPGDKATRRAKVVYRIGGWTFLEPLSPFKKSMYRMLERWTARFKDSIICVHPGDVETARASGIKPKGSVFAVPNGIDVATFDVKLLPRHDARRILRLPQDLFIYGTVANFYPAKNIPQYLDTCAEIFKRHPASRFVLLGDGPEYAAVEERIKALGLEDFVFMPGSRDDAATLLRAFDAFVLPSVKEGMSWALLEAMAAGVPCIATDVGAARWMLEDGEAGWIVPTNDTRALVDAMSQTRDRALSETKAARARTAVEQRFPLEQTFQKNAEALLG